MTIRINHYLSNVIKMIIANINIRIKTQQIPQVLKNVQLDLMN